MTNTDPDVDVDCGPSWIEVGKRIQALTKGPSSWSKLADQIEELGTPTANYFAKTLRGSISKRGKTMGRLKANVNYRKDGPAVYFFLRAFRWHGGSTGASLYGPMMDQFGGEDYHRADTMAGLLRIALGLPMVAADRWKEVLS